MYQHDLLMIVAASAEIAVSANHGNMVEYERAVQPAQACQLVEGDRVLLDDGSVEALTSVCTVLFCSVCLYVCMYVCVHVCM